MFGQVIIAAPGNQYNKTINLHWFKICCMYWQHSVDLPKQSRHRALHVHVAFISTYSILYLNYFVLVKTASTEPEIPIHQRHDESKNVITAVHVVLCEFKGKKPSNHGPHINWSNKPMAQKKVTAPNPLFSSCLRLFTMTPHWFNSLWDCFDFLL